uniref:PASTA domain-containing protein n=1 Tax=Candidatus Enterococcus willemsii TaxID=1857215 RepID=UPI00403FACC8
MSDFLSNFTKNNYDGQKKEPSEKKAIPAEELEESAAPEPAVEEPVIEETEKVEEAPVSRRAKKEAPVSRFQTEETEFDPTYKKRQRKKYLFIGTGAALLALILFFTYYQLTHVKVPDFVNKDVSEVRSWGTEEGVAIEVEQKYDFDMDVNKVISQAVKPDKKIKKGKTLNIVGSLGADPEEQLTLPDFSKLSKKEATAWIDENKAENISLIESFDESIEAGKFIKQEVANKELKLEDYKRKDRLSVYYSKGKETFEKNIEVPDFKGKTIADVTEWTKKNEVKLKRVDDFSSEIKVDEVISQETAKGEKIAKQDEFVVHISKGKAITVPDYSKYTMEEAANIEAKIPVVLKNVYTSDVSYGQFISQSEEAGKEYGEGDTIPPVEIVYSLGQPYIKDLRGSTQEGDLPKLFFDEYQSKGAYINYQVYYVDSEQPKGTVVEMSQYGQFLPLETTISIGISLGNLKPTTPTLPVQSEPESESDDGLTGRETSESEQEMPQPY